MAIKLLKTFDFDEFVNNWRLVSTVPNFQKVLQHLNLSDLNNFTSDDLEKLKQKFEINLYLESAKINESNTKHIEGTLSTKKNAFNFLGIIVLITRDLRVLFDKSSHKEILIIDGSLVQFIAYKRKTNEFSVKYSTDQEIIYSAAFNDIIWFQQIINSIADHVDEEEDLKKSNIYLSISFKKASGEKPGSRPQIISPSGDMSL
ncbi:MAG TPA: hypothetical protein VIJ27_07015 [Mucilaginibacter sp.]